MGKMAESSAYCRVADRISYEKHSGEQLVRLFFVKNPRTWFTIELIQEFLEENGKKLTSGSLYNIISNLKSIGFLESRRSSFAEYHLRELKSEVHPAGGSSRVRRWRLDFFDYLEALCWEDVCRVHDIRLWTPVARCDFTGDGWSWRDSQRKFSKHALVGKFRFTFEVYVKARTLVVSVGCANSPIAVGVEGLTRFYSVVCRVRACFLNSVSVPDVCDWIVTQWHYGRDSKDSQSGKDFELTFHDWFKNLCRVYVRHDGHVRLERVENPNIRFTKLLNGQGKLQHDE